MIKELLEENNVEISNYDEELEEIDRELNAYLETFDEFIKMYKDELERSEKVLENLKIIKKNNINENIIKNDEYFNKYDDDFKIFEELEKK